MVKVIKKNKKLEGYKPAKIVRACKKAGAPEVIAKAIASAVSKKVRRRKTVKATDIQKMVLGMLTKTGKAADNWKKFLKKKKRR